MLVQVCYHRRALFIVHIYILLQPLQNLFADITLVDDELVKVVRVGNISLEVEDDHMVTEDDTSLAGLNEEFLSQILSGVRFAPLVISPAVSTIIPANVWN